MKKKPKYDDAMRQMVGAVDRGIQQIRGASGVTKDYDVALYESLNPLAFELMSEELGDDVVSNYILGMEKKRMSLEGD